MSRTVILVLFIALLQLVAGGRQGGFAAAFTGSFSSVKGKGRKSSAGATGLGVAVGKNADATSFSATLAKPNKAASVSFATASTGGKKPCKKGC